MKLILSYNEYNLTRNLSESELSDYLYVTENLEEGIVDRLVDIAKKGTITAALAASLVGNPAYSNAIEKLPEPQKAKIENIIAGKTDVIYIYVGDNFSSGEYRISEKQKASIIAQLQDMLVKAKEKGKNFNITVESSESNVPNRDIKTKQSLNSGELAEKRGAVIQDLLIEFLNNEKDYPSFALQPVDTNPIKSSDKAPWDKEAASKLSHENLVKLVNDPKYTVHQFVRIALSKNVKGSTPCNIVKVNEGEQGTAEKNYVSFNTMIPVVNQYGSGSLILDSGEIPDRVVLVADDNFNPEKAELNPDKVIADSGYKSSFEHRTHKHWLYIPAHVLKLTQLMNEKASAVKETKFFKNKLLREGTDFKSFSNGGTFKELVQLLLKDKDYDYDDIKDKDARNDEIGGAGSKIGPLAQIKRMFEKGQKEFMIYEVGTGSKASPDVSDIPYLLQGQYKQITAVVYSPLGLTMYKLYAACGVNIKTP